MRPPTVLDLGSVVNGKYKLVRLLGDGGMGSVYEAHHVALATRVAIKVLHPELVRRTGLVERFLQEARLAAQIRSPHVVQVTDVDRTPEGHAYIVMELLEGEPLSSLLDRQHTLPIGAACAYAGQILEALEAAHALGVIHRDLKPENVFVTFASGKPVLKLIDFGIAKDRSEGGAHAPKNLTVAGVVMGTAEYMAPEQAHSAENVDARADIYAVGVMLYEMIAGQRPVNGDDARVIAVKVQRGEIVPLLQAAPSTPRELAGLVHRAMAARPELRFASATEMRLFLGAVATGKRPPTVAMPPSKTASAVDGSAPAPERPRAATPEPRSPSPSAAKASEPSFDTIRAPPLATALIAPAYAPNAPSPPNPPNPALVPAGASDRRRKGSRRLLLAGVAIPLLLGAGVVGAGVVGWGGVTPWASSAPAAATTSPAAPIGLPGTPATPSVALASGAAPSPEASVPALVPTRPMVVPTRPAPPARTQPSAGPNDASAPVSVIFPPGFPSALPPFPGVLPGILSLPPGFPTSLPSAFPSAAPPWPSMPTPQPAASRPPPAEY